MVAPLSRCLPRVRPSNWENDTLSGQSEMAVKAEVHTEGIQRRSNSSLARMKDEEPEASYAEYKAPLRRALTQGRLAYDGGFKALRMP